MTGAQNAGRIEAMHDAEDMGITVKKRWIATLDKRTRDAHAELDGQIVDVDEPFTVNGMTIMYPGDPNADPSLVYNCRCTLGYEYPEYSTRGQRRDNETGEVIDYKTYKEWEKSKSDETKSTDSYDFVNTVFVDKQYDTLDDDESKVESIFELSGLSRAESEKVGRALFGYGGDADYCYFNGADRDIRALKTEEAKEMSKSIQHYINAAPKYEGTIYRGMSVQDDVLDKLVPGSVFDESKYSISSWSSRQDIGQRFANVSYYDYGGNRVVFEITNHKHGTPVGHLSPTPIESEVLVNNKDVQYRIVSRENYMKKDRKFTRIVLEEL